MTTPDDCQHAIEFETRIAFLKCINIGIWELLENLLFANICRGMYEILTSIKFTAAVHTRGNNIWITVTHGRGSKVINMHNTLKFHTTDFYIGEEYAGAIYGEREYKQKGKKDSRKLNCSLKLVRCKVHCYMHNDTLLIYT